MFRVPQKKRLYAIGLLAMFTASMNAYAGRHDIPPRQNLYVAKQHVRSLQYHVQNLISKCNGQSGSDNGRDEPRSDGPRGCIGISETEDSGNVIENDNLANIALQVMGREVFELGQQLDQAIMYYGTPSVGMYINQVCHKASKLLIANQGAKVSAALPINGYVQAVDFDPNDDELQAVRQQLWCY